MSAVDCPRCSTPTRRVIHGSSGCLLSHLTDDQMARLRTAQEDMAEHYSMTLDEAVRAVTREDPR